MRRLLTGAAVCSASLTVLVGVARAEDQDGKAIDACHNKRSTVETVDCLGKITDQWDKRLNAAYQTALRKADPAAVAPLRASERAWLEYRKQRCLYVSAGEGTITQITAADCFLSTLRARTNELISDSAGLAGSGG